MSNTILVIGATGNVGRPLVERLTGQGEPVRAATRHPETFTATPGVDRFVDRMVETEQRRGAIVVIEHRPPRRPRAGPVGRRDSRRMVAARRVLALRRAQ